MLQENDNKKTAVNHQKSAYNGHFWHPRLDSNQWPVA